MYVFVTFMVNHRQGLVEARRKEKSDEGEIALFCLWSLYDFYYILVQQGRCDIVD